MLHIYKTSNNKAYLHMFDKLDLNCTYALMLDYNITFYEIKRFINVIKFYVLIYLI